MARLGLALGGLLAVALAALWLLGSGVLGSRWENAEPTAPRVSAQTVEARSAAQRRAADDVGALRPDQILFGDLHVHTTFSPDAFMSALPMTGGVGAHPISDACDFARWCAALDFWSINDHAIGHTPWKWQQTIDGIRECNAIAESSENPDTVAYLGWEWTQIGTNPDNHYGHKNVILRGQGDGEIPTRPIAARIPGVSDDTGLPGPLAMGLFALANRSSDALDSVRFLREMEGVPDCPDGVPVRDLPDDCREGTRTPAELFAKLDDWGFDSMVIPHGTSWGFYTPMGSAWDKQLVGDMHDAGRQSLIEVFSGHGNSEEFRDWREVIIDADGSKSCPGPREDYLPSCWRAGELVRARCAEAGETDEECEQRAFDARQHYVDADTAGHLTVPGAEPDEWLDSGQCRDCFQPSFNHRPKSSVQYIMALSDFADPKRPRRFDFGFMASSDNHTARPGTGYKEFARPHMTEARLMLAGARMFDTGLAAEPEREPRSRAFDPDDYGGQFFRLRESERASSFFLTGGLIGVHAKGRSRDAIWTAMERKQVYGTSGPRILVWFDLLNPPGSSGRSVGMGGKVRLDTDPVFQVRAVGSLEQQPGCPAEATEALTPEGVAKLCRGECYNPTDQRRLITRIEVVRIRPQVREGEPVADLIEDPWRVLPCDADPSGCTQTFTDPEFRRGGRDALYYVRAIEAPSPAVNAGLLRCETDGEGGCLEVKPCFGVPESDDCLAETEERAWSSPIFVEQADGRAAIEVSDRRKSRSDDGSWAVRAETGPGGLQRMARSPHWRVNLRQPRCRERETACGKGCA
jgi:hypothetical protein